MSGFRVRDTARQTALWEIHRNRGWWRIGHGGYMNVPSESPSARTHTGLYRVWAILPLRTGNPARIHSPRSRSWGLPCPRKSTGIFSVGANVSASAPTTKFHCCSSYWQDRQSSKKFGSVHGTDLADSLKVRNQFWMRHSSVHETNARGHLRVLPIVRIRSYPHRVYKAIASVDARRFPRCNFDNRTLVHFSNSRRTLTAIRLPRASGRTYMRFTSMVPAS